MNLVLIMAVLAGSTLSGVIGMGGGVLLVAVMATMLDPALVVPLHGVIQLVSNSTRSWALWRRVDWGRFLLYTPTLLIGAALGSRLYVESGLPWFRPLVGAFALAFLLWDRFRPSRLMLPRWIFLPAGLLGGVITMLVGASGFYLATFFLRDDLDREQIVATKAAIQTVGHLVKIPAFLAIGFDYRIHLDLLLPLLVCAVSGTLLGTRILKRLPEAVFQTAFRVLLTLLGLRLVLSPWL